MNTREAVTLSTITTTPVARQIFYEPVIIPAGSIEKDHRQLVEDHFRLRHDRFAVEYGWEDVREDGMESDDYDAGGLCDYVLLVHRNNKTVGAGCRLIRSTQQIKLPVQELLFDPDSIPVGAIEISRMTGTRETARSSLSLLGYLFGYLSDCGVTNVYMTIRERLLERYEHSGFNGYELLPGQAMEKISKKKGEKETTERFLPAMIELTGYQQALQILSRLCA